MEPTSPSVSPAAGSPMGRVLASRSNWEQLGKFCIVGAVGYALNLAVYGLLLHRAGLHYIPAAIGSFLVAVMNNYLWNRLWTFRTERGGVGRQGARFFIVSTISLGANLAVLQFLVTAGVEKFPAQAIAIVLVTPLNFIGNKLWSFRSS